MKSTKIQQGKCYETTHGVGICLGTGSSFKVQIIGPLPLGVRYLQAREILRETADPRGAHPEEKDRVP